MNNQKTTNSSLFFELLQQKASAANLSISEYLEDLSDYYDCIDILEKKEKTSSLGEYLEDFKKRHGVAP